MLLNIAMKPARYAKNGSLTVDPQKNKYIITL